MACEDARQLSPLARKRATRPVAERRPTLAFSPQKSDKVSCRSSDATQAALTSSLCKGDKVNVSKAVVVLTSSP